MTSLPTPEQWVIRKMSLEETAEMIERHIDFVDKDGHSVHLPTKFVRHYMRRDDGALPTIVAVSTLPLVFADGGVWAEDKSTGCAVSISVSSRKYVPAYRRRTASPTTLSSGRCVPHRRMAGRRRYRLCRQMHHRRRRAYLD